MNFRIKHVGSTFIDETIIEWASGITRTEADSRAEEIERFLDGKLEEEHRDALHELEDEHRAALGEAEKRQYALRESLAAEVTRLRAELEIARAQAATALERAQAFTADFTSKWVHSTVRVAMEEAQRAVKGTPPPLRPRSTRKGGKS